MYKSLHKALLPPLALIISSNLLFAHCSNPPLTSNPNLLDEMRTSQRNIKENSRTAPLSPTRTLKQVGVVAYLERSALAREPLEDFKPLADRFKRSGTQCIRIEHKVEQTIQAQLKIGLSPLREINPKLKQLLAGQQELKAQLKELTALVRAEGSQTRALLEKLRRENLTQHRKTQRLVVGLQQARYSAALRLIQLASESLHDRQTQAQQLFNEALTALLETQSYHRSRLKAGDHVSREIQALIHISLTTCYLGMGLKRQAVREVAALVSTANLGEGLSYLA